MFDITIAVLCEETVQLSRLVKRDDMTEEKAKNMIYAQIPNARKAELADYAIINNRGKKDLLRKVNTLLKKLDEG